jgi:ribosomal protein S18 acetylase RimI-like enzyme
MSVLIRKALLQDAQAIVKVHVDSWRTTYAGIVSAEFLASLSYQQRQKMWDSILLSPSGPSFVYVAETPDQQVVGFASAGPERGGADASKGEIYALYLLQGFQRHGIGRELFNTAASELRQRGYDSLILWVLADNSARAFYEAMGGMFLREKEVDIGGQHLVEVAYGWKNIFNSAL